MSDDKLKLSLELEVKATGKEQIKKIDSDLASIERRTKAIVASIRAAAGFASNPSRVKSGADPVRAARDNLGIDRDRLRVLKLRMGFEAKARADLERAARQQARGDERRYRLSMAFNDRMLKQRERMERAESAARARQDREREQAFRRQFRFNSTIARLRAAEERASERDRERNERARTRAESLRNRMQEREDRRAGREQESARSRIRSRGRDTVEHGRDAYYRLTRPPAYAVAAGTAGTAAIAQRALGAEIDTDTAEVNARIFGNLSKQAARDLREKWAVPLSTSLGLSAAKLMTAYVDSIKVGIPEADAKKVTELAAQASEGWGVSYESVLDTFGTQAAIMTSQGKAFSFPELKTWANSSQYLAAGMATTSEKLLEFSKHAAGGAALLGMSQDAALSFGAASTSLGNRAGESGTLLDYIASRVIEMPEKAREKGQEGKKARGLLRDLGYGSAADMDAERRASPDSFLLNLHRRMAGIADTQRREQAMLHFFGREWIGEGSRNVTGIAEFEKAERLRKEAKSKDALGEVWELHKTKLMFVLKQFSVGWNNILGEIGKVLSPLAGDVSRYFVEWSKKLSAGGFSARVRAAIDGLVEGFGLMSLPALLEGVLGKPGEGNPGAVEQWKSATKAFAEGIRDIFGSIKSVISAFTGGDPELIARWTGRIVALSAALFVLGPVLTVLGGFVALIQTVAASVAAVAAIKGAASVAGAGAAGGIASAAILTTIGGVIGTAIFAKIANSLGILIAPDTSKGYGRAFVEFLDPGLARRLFGEDKLKSDRADGNTPSSWQDPPSRSDTRTTQERQLDELARLRKLAEDAAKTEKDKADKQESISGLLHKSSLDDTVANQWTRFSKDQLHRFQDGLTRIPNEARSANTGSWNGSVTGGPLSGSVGGGTLGNSGLSGRGIIGGHGAVPGTGPGAAEAGPGATGGSRSWRNNNPGNIEYGPFARSMGATGSDGRFAKFPSYDTGRKAQETLLFESKGYRDLTLQQAIRRWAPASENNVPAYIAAMGGGGGNKRMSEYTPEERGKLLDAMQRHEGWKVGQGGRAYTPSPASAATTFRDGIASQAVANATKLIGLGSSGAAQALGARMTPGQWCADFVNGALRSAGIKGVNSSIANSFQSWGNQVTDEIKQGDVLVEHRGRGAGNPGGHVGIATGMTRMGPRGVQFEQISGNHGGRVARSWVDASRVAARRAVESAEAAAASARGNVEIGGGMTPSGWRKAEGLGQSAPLGGTTPIRNEKLMMPAPATGRGASAGTGGGGGGGVNININGHNADPETLANTVQRKLRESMNRRTHDIDHVYT